jgi:hypothetical protein
VRTVGAADELGPAARTVRVRRCGVAARGVLGRGARRGAWTSGDARPQAEKSSGKKACGHGRRGSAGAGRRRRGALAPDLTQFVGPTFEIEFLQNFEYNSTKL